MSWIVTATGKRFDLLDPKPNQIDIRDIAMSLSRLCRFTGHCSRFYSVAEHSLIGANTIDTYYQREFLLHDAAEAYTGDMNSPLKQMCPDFKTIQNNIDAAIRKKFHLSCYISSAVMYMDLRMLATEKRDLMKVTLDKWQCIEGIPPIITEIPATFCPNIDSIYRQFMATFKFYFRKHT